MKLSTNENAVKHSDNSVRITKNGTSEKIPPQGGPEKLKISCLVVTDKDHV